MSEQTQVTTNAQGHEVALYFATESRGDKLRRFANAAADIADRMMAMGYEESQFMPHAEMADELSKLAEFIDPTPTLVITSSWTAGGSLWANGDILNATQ